MVPEPTSWMIVIGMPTFGFTAPKRANVPPNEMLPLAARVP